MKNKILHKKKAFPLATHLKKTDQQWDLGRKLSFKEKRLFKNKIKFYSMEYGRSLSKKLLWEIATVSSRNDEHISQLFSFSPQKTEKKGTNLEDSIPQRIAPFQQSWTLFRSIFFGKMWSLNNPSLVPGLVWPIKSKKTYLAKLRAWKALSQLTGKTNLKYLKNNLQMLWNLPTHLVPSRWSLAAGLDSIKTSTLLKSGWVVTHPTAFNEISCGHYSLNGVRSNKSLGFNYPGDFFSMSFLESIPKTNMPIMENMSTQKSSPFFSHQSIKTALVFGKLFNSSPARIFKQQNLSQSSVLPFLWTSSFYQDGIVVNIQGQRGMKNKRSFKKKSFGFTP